jgi:hypothetical protein
MQTNPDGGPNSEVRLIPQTLLFDISAPPVMCVRAVSQLVVILLSLEPFLLNHVHVAHNQ